MIEKYKLPGLEILKKYDYSIVREENLITVISVKKPVSHFDRQRLFSLCWKIDPVKANTYYYDNILSLRKRNQ